MIQIAFEQPAGKLLYLPYLQGERSPFIDPHARGVWLGMNRQTNRASLTRAVLEEPALPSVMLYTLYLRFE